MGILLRAAIMGWMLALLTGCQYANLDDPQTGSPVDSAPAYQVYLRPRIDPIDFTLIEQRIVIRDRLTGAQRVVDTVQPSLRPFDFNTRLLTFGRFIAASGDASGSDGARIVDSQARRLLYLTDGTPLSGGQLWELQLDRLDAPIRRLSLDENICSVFAPLFNFADIEESAVTYALPGPRNENCSDADRRPLRQLRLSFDGNERSIPVGSDFRRLGTPLNRNGSVIRQLVDVEVDDEVPQSELVSCPFFLGDLSQCQTIKLFDNLDGCRLRDGCEIVPGGRCSIVDNNGDDVPDVRRCSRQNPQIRTLQGQSSRDDDVSVRTLPGPPYRLSNQFFRVGRVDKGVPTHGVLTLYRQTDDVVPDQRLIDIHRFETQFRRNGFINCENDPSASGCENPPGVLVGTKISASPSLTAITDVSEAADPDDGDDRVFFADGAVLYRLDLKRNDPATFTLVPIYSPDPAGTQRGGEILNVRTLGNDVVIRWCGPVNPPFCDPAVKDAICQLAVNSCPEDAHEREQAIFAVPMSGSAAIELDRIRGGVLTINALTPTALTYTAEQRGDSDGNELAPKDIQRKARLLGLDRNRNVIRHSVNLPPFPGVDSRAFDGSLWLGDSATAAANEGLDDTGRSSISQGVLFDKLGAGGQGETATRESSGLVLRTRRGGDTELFAVDLGGASPADGPEPILLGTLSARRDLRDHPECDGISRRSGRLLPGASGGVLSGSDRRVLIQLSIPRSAEFQVPVRNEFGERVFETFPALSDTDIYAADLDTPGSLVPVSRTEPPPSPGKRVFCPDIRRIINNEPIPIGMNAANDQLITR